MNMADVMTKLGQNDLRLARRDQFLITLLVYGFIMIGIIRYLLPMITNTLLSGELNFDLQPYYPLIISTLVIHQVSAVMGGTITGFLLLDERDDQTIRAIMVTPMPINLFVMYKILVPMLLGFILGFVGLSVLAPFTTLNLVQILLISLINSLFAALVCLFLATFANNKVEGFAMIKIVGSLSIIVFGGWFIQEPYQFLLGFYPPYWTMKAFWSIEAGVSTSKWLSFLILSLITHSIALWYFVRRFNHTIYEG